MSHSRTASPTPANVAGRIGRCPLSGSSPACIGGVSIHITPPWLPTEHPQSPEMLQRYVISSLSGTRGPNPRGLHRERDDWGGGHLMPSAASADPRSIPGSKALQHGRLPDVQKQKSSISELPKLTTCTRLPLPNYHQNDPLVAGIARGPPASHCRNQASIRSDGSPVPAPPLAPFLLKGKAPAGGHRDKPVPRPAASAILECYLCVLNIDTQSLIPRPPPCPPTHAFAPPRRVAPASRWDALG